MKQKKAKKVILWAADVFGPHFLNNQLLMDWHAANGQSSYLQSPLSACLM
jgi:hypothetical protein